LDGGLENGAITQFYGASKVGKTHLCHLLCAVLPLHCKVIYIDTEDGFSSTKIRYIAQARGLSLGEILRNTTVAKVGTVREQEQCIESLQNKINSESGIKLLIVDSMTHLYRAEFTERSELSERQAKLSKYSHLLSRIAQTNNIAVVITNQVHSNPRPYSESDKLKPIGGNVLSYPCKYIVSLEDYGSQYRRATLEKSPYRPPFSLPLMIGNRGFEDKDPFLPTSDQ
jgi:RecA/RadA recombinase